MAEARIAELENALAAEKRKTASLNQEINRLQTSRAHQQLSAEAEEEAVVNKLVHRLDELAKEKEALAETVWREEAELDVAHKALAQAGVRLEAAQKEKETLARQVEQEEEFMVNTLQKKLQQVKLEKVALENQLESEQEYISNKLQKQIQEVQAEKRTLEIKLEEEHKLLAQKDLEKKTLQKSLQDLQNHIEEQQECITNKLQKQISELSAEKAKAEERLQVQSRGHEKLQGDLLRLQNENYVLNQRIKREHDKYVEMNKDRARLFQGWEMQLERSTLECLRRDAQLALPENFNVMRRHRSQSLPSTPLMFEKPHLSSFLHTRGTTPSPEASRSSTPPIRELESFRDRSPGLESPGRAYRPKGHL
mmetsp:Transcript_31390/g.72199  ORF Transcript_31390/g.72199 Transcript_31390/m.72199 type:complete len:366 (-) Transcript_31390:118-1215(-)|eukprot:CAMPEP_0114557882 /NCGR_PEP_ID=MMETSP0114-20121206/10072_1 /TAXON_ID=31324 /ORGANISM="Goniomonas sp, Strain m" /LENGTH=365 /DNA_ID=CAMNT_0001743209 /DNA_START=54 /DNA_END=1151 /DNA_ORIENTATION=-